MQFLFLLMIGLMRAHASIPSLDEKRATDFARLSLTCIDQEFPNSHGEETFPKKMHPAFYGCYDWHSAVHGHWALVRVLKTFPTISIRNEIEKKLDSHFQPEIIQGEISYFKKPQNSHFERPYGYAWFLRLMNELRLWNHPKAKAWSEILEPLETWIVQRLEDYLDLYTVPARHGIHSNTAFALAQGWDYAKGVGNQKLLEKIEKKAKAFYLSDKNCSTEYEPSGGDFLSGCLAEADLMLRVLPKKKFTSWFNQFLPTAKLKPLYSLKLPSNPKDPIVGHMIGLMFYKAQVMTRLAAALPGRDTRKTQLLNAASTQSSKGVELMFDSGYGGTHWLATYAIYLMTL